MESQRTATKCPPTKPAVQKKKHKTKKESYRSYIYKVLHGVHPDTGMSSRAMSIMDGFAEDMFLRIANEARELVKHGKRTTMSWRDIETAVRLIVPGELLKHAVAEGRKALAKSEQSLSLKNEA